MCIQLCEMGEGVSWRMAFHPETGSFFFCSLGGFFLDPPPIASWACWGYSFVLRFAYFHRFWEFRLRCLWQGRLQLGIQTGSRTVASYLSPLYFWGKSDRSDFTVKFRDHAVVTRPAVIISNTSTVHRAQLACLSVFSTNVSLGTNMPVPPVSA